MTIILFSHFYLIASPTYGNCFTFNSNDPESTDSLGGRRRSSLAGPSLGLSLVVSLEQPSYMEVHRQRLC